MADITPAGDEAHYRRLFEQNPLPTWIWETGSLRILDVNQAAIDNYGYSREEFLRMNLRDLRPPEDVPRLEKALLRTMPEVDRGTWRHCRKDGSVLDVYVCSRDFHTDRVSGRMAVALDITEQLRAEEERQRAQQKLRANQERLQALSRQMLRLQEDERRSLARELHDEVGQQLAALKFNLAALKRELENTPAQAKVDDSLDIVNTTLSIIRDTALDLRPSMLDDLGLVPALEWYCSRQAARSGCEIRLDAPLQTRRLSTDLETACFRIVQEAVNNALRHARPGRIDVSLEQEERRIVLRVTDDGAGFDVTSALKRSQYADRLGLLGMRERAELLGGRFTVTSAAGQGSTVSADLPLPVTAGPAHETRHTNPAG